MRIRKENDVLVLSLESSERLWACKREVRIPVSTIVSIVSGVPEPRFFEFRAPGTSIPGIVKAGTFWSREGKEFWYVVPGKPAYVTITLSEGAPYRRIILGCDESCSKELESISPVSVHAPLYA